MRDIFKKNSFQVRVVKSLVISLFFVMTVIWFGPTEIFSANSYEFAFALKDYWLTELLFGLIVMVLLSTILSFSSCVFRIGNTILFAFSLCCYIQTMFFNGQMESFNNQEIIWSTGVKITNFLLWTLLFLSILYMVHRKRDSIKYMIYVSFFLSIIQFVALVSILFLTGLVKEDKNGYLSVENMNVLAKQSNVIVFILDYYDGTYVEETFKERPDLINGLDGFVYYPNATSIHSRTYPSLPYLFSGEICYFDKEPREYIKDAYDNWNLFDQLKGNKIDVGYYGYDYFLSDSVKKSITNYEPRGLRLDNFRICKYMLKMVLYRDLPYAFKSRFKYDVDDINDDVRKEQEDKNVDGIEPFKVFNDTWFGEYIKGKPLVVSNDIDKAFRFYHLGGCHRDLSNPIPQGIESLEIVEKYLQQLRDLGVYKDATIIIMADHGKSGGGPICEELPQGTAVPLMLVKPSDAYGISMEVNGAPVSHTDFIPTVCDAFGIECDNEKITGNPIYQIKDISRERYYYHTALESDEIGESLLQEYRVDGDARDPKSYVHTGNEWEVKYSLNKVATK